MPKLIRDEFTDMDISRERKRQMRLNARGLCLYAKCGKPLATKNHCLGHAIQSRESQRVRHGRVRRYSNSRTYQLTP